MVDPVQLGPITVVVEESPTVISVEEVSILVTEAEQRNRIEVDEDFPNVVYVGASPTEAGGNQVISFNRSNLLEVTQGQARFFFPSDAALIEITPGVSNAPEGSDIIIDVNLNDVSLFAPEDRPRILENEVVGVGVSDFLTAIVDEGDYLTVDIDQVGSTTPGDFLTVTIVYRLL